MTQVIKGDIKVIVPREYREAEPVFPLQGLTPSARRPQRCRRSMLDFGILFPSLLNGLTTGAVYALIALGLTLIYGVLHIINFAHGAALMVALYGVYLLKTQLGIDPYLALPIVVPGMFVLGYALQRGVINRASHGKDENILLVTLGLAIVMENLALLAFKSDTRTIETRLHADHRADRPGHDRAAQAGRLRRRAGGVGAAAVDRQRAPTWAARSARWPRRSRAPS